MITVPQENFARPGWQRILSLTVLFWLSGTVILDGVIMPSLYLSGMMVEPGFASAGYSLFWVFNRLELLCAAIVLTAAFVLRYTHAIGERFHEIISFLAILLLGIVCVDTYWLTPHMSALGAHLNLFAPTAAIPTGMDQLHVSYWVLELIKLTAGLTLFKLTDRLGRSSI
ncbi:hypothetical protein ACN4EK_11345 [Pantanalinema rosaneae CENA516]|uniref:hypothetical protein n=1 Tax=Pantanalinema rosaneae TaxID=1620701 RepID=UPI003D701C4F